MSAAAPRRWSLGGRLSRLFLWSTLAFVLVIASMSAIALERAVEGTIDARTEEEIEEMAAHFGKRGFDRAMFLEQVDEQIVKHRRLPMGWRAWSREGELLAERGEPGLVALTSRATPEGDAITTRLGRGTRAATVELADGTLLALALDGAFEFEPLWRYARWTGGAALACAACALALSGWFSRRVSRMLASVADQARAARPADAPRAIEVEGAPDEIRAVIDALHDMLARIRGETEAQRIYLAGMAHELRAPLQNLLGEAEVALRQPRDAAAYRAVLTSHVDELRALGDAIDNLVAISSREVAARAQTTEAFDLGEEARIRLARERAAAQREGVEVSLDVRGDARVVGDREALMRALRNLVQNAIQWSPPGSRVDIAIAGGPRDLELTVDDCGPGVPDEMRSSIFEPFVRGPAARGRRIGYGLGLALVKGAADAQGGEVHVERSPKGGARFRVKIPRTR